MIKRPRLSTAALAFTALTLAACGDSDAATTQPTETVESTEPASTEPAETTETAEAEAPTEPEATGLAGLAIITISNGADGNGERPQLAWGEVPGATEYTVILNTADGGPYWTWSGPQATVWLGGTDEEPNANSEGPTLFEPLTMRVFASGPDGEPLAASEPTVIAS